MHEVASRRKFVNARYGVASLLLVTTIIALAFGMLVPPIKQLRVQRAAAETLSQMGCLVFSERPRTSDEPSRSLSLAERLLRMAGEEGPWHVDSVWGTRSKIDDAGLVHLRHLPGLRALNLESTAVTDAGLIHIESLFGLEVLDLTNTAITDDGLKSLENLFGLERLSLAGTRITDTGLRHIQGLTRIRHLDLSNTSVSDAGMVRLQELSQLEHLNLEGTKLTGDGILWTRGLKHLKYLNFHRTKVTHSACMQVKWTRLDVEVIP